MTKIWWLQGYIYLFIVTPAVVPAPDSKSKGKKPAKKKTATPAPRKSTPDTTTKKLVKKTVQAMTRPSTSKTREVTNQKTERPHTAAVDKPKPYVLVVFINGFFQTTANSLLG